MPENGDFDFAEELKKLPSSPGVYIMHDAHDAIIYVGKARSLKNRVRQYFQAGYKRSPKIERMVGHISRFEYIVTDSELEALILESNLIKENRPKYNTMLMDDKNYPYIKVTVRDEYPRIVLAHGMEKDGARYFGPYANAGAARDTVELLSRLYRLRPCSRKIDAGQAKPEDRACLYYHIGQCPAPCIGIADGAEYAENVKKAIRFLKGDVSQEIKSLTEKMQKASEELRFEEAASYRDAIKSIRDIASRQKITETGGSDRDVIAVAVDPKAEGTKGGGEPEPAAGENSGAGAAHFQNERDAVVQIFFVRGGKLIGREHFFLRTSPDDTKGDLLRAFILQYYNAAPFIPKELLLNAEPSEKELLSEWLSSRRGGNVRLSVPAPSVKHSLAFLAAENAELELRKDRERLKRQADRTTGAVEEIRSLLNLPTAARMESYDISHISGTDSVGAMVVFENGLPKKTDYRKFKLRHVEGPDDYASMKEVLTRRFTRAKEGDAGFSKLPDVILMDGGVTQVHAAKEVLESLQLDVPVAGMVKDDKHRTRALFYEEREVPISRDSEGFRLLERIQDEVHRFAITYHRLLRSKGQVKSVLDDIKGIGPSRRRALMAHFKTIEAIRDASEEELAAAPGMNKAAAKSVREFFHSKESIF